MREWISKISKAMLTLLVNVDCIFLSEYIIQNVKQ